VLPGFGAITPARFGTSAADRCSLASARGSADLIGYRSITITPEMVGQQVAVFTSIEVKTPTGRLRPEQQAWLDTVQAAGGIAGVARSVEDALRIMTAHG
jgi:hypothetical protein